MIEINAFFVFSWASNGHRVSEIKAGEDTKGLTQALKRFQPSVFSLGDIGIGSQIHAGRGPGAAINGEFFLFIIQKP